jgi:hypothetical protein
MNEKEKETMTDFRATMIAEGVEEAESTTEVLEAWSHLIKTGLCWRLQGFFGRSAASLIENGIISKEGEILVTEEEL